MKHWDKEIAKENEEVKKKNDADHAIRMKNKKHIHNSITGECIRVDVSEINEYLSNGWIAGGISRNKNKRKSPCWTNPPRSTLFSIE